MLATALIRSSAVALALSFTASGALAQAQRAPKAFEPEVGQAGKDVVWVPTPQAVVDKMLELAKVTKDDFLMDLGSGDGRTVITAAKRGARALGIEYNPDMVELSKRNAEAEGVSSRAQFQKADLFQTDFSKATVVTVYLLPQLIGDLQPRFIATLKPGTRIVSHAFRMAGWRPDGSETLRLSGSHPGQGDESTLYLWIVPADVRGTWAGDGVRVRIEQNYQDVEIEGASGAVLKGAEISWQSPRGGFRGRVQGARIVGELTVDGKTRAVTLRRR